MWTPYTTPYTMPDWMLWFLHWFQVCHLCLLHLSPCVHNFGLDWTLATDQLDDMRQACPLWFVTLIVCGRCRLNSSPLMSKLETDSFSLLTSWAEFKRWCEMADAGSFQMLVTPTLQACVLISCSLTSFP